MVTVQLNTNEIILMLQINLTILNVDKTILCGILIIGHNLQLHPDNEIKLNLTHPQQNVCAKETQ